MSTRVRKVLTTIDASGNPFSEIHTETLVGEKWFPNDPVPLANAGPEAIAWQSQFSAAVSAKYDAEVTAHASTLAQLQAMTGERDRITQDLQAMTSARDEAIAKRDELQTERDQLTEQLQTAGAKEAELTAEVERLTALIPPPREDYQVTRAEFLARLQAADPQVIVDIWKSQSAESILAAVSLFTHDGVIDLRPGQRTHLMLQSLIPLGIITKEQVDSILIEV